MLALSRKPGESIVLSGGITITVIRIQGGRTRIGISAPRDIHIAREELLRRHQAGTSDPALASSPQKSSAA